MTRIIQKSVCLFFAVLLSCFLLALQLSAQDATGRSTIHLKSGNVAPEPNAAAWIDATNSQVRVQPVQVLIHFSSLPSKEHRELLRQNGVTLLDYIPDNTYTAIIQGPLDQDKILSVPIHSIIDSKAEWKADGYMWKKIAKTEGQVEVLVSFCPGIGTSAIRQFITSEGGWVDPGPMEQYGSYKVIIASGAVKEMAAWYGVRYISPVTKMVPLDLQSRPAVKGNLAVASPLYGGYDLLGDSITVGVGDNTSGIYHADMQDRVTNFNPAAITHHGVFVNGIVGSAAIIDPLSEGQAPHVNLVDFLFDLILPATGAMYHDYNMTITNNSYTVIEGDCDYSGTYDAYSVLLDTLEIQYPYVQHVFAAGNDGLLNCSPYLPGFATVGGGYQPAKNDIVVGSMTDQLVQANDESRGPVKDGRLKPELIAVGYGVYSEIANTDYEISAGTSFASPQVAGGLAALTQRYKQLHSGAQPRADLLKTVLLDACMDLGNPGPDYSYGFGAMDVDRSLKILDNNQYRTGDINNADSQLVTLNIPANTAQVKVMLYWNDVPASPSSATQLINDLDVVVKDPSAERHLPLVLDATPANVNNNATEQEDHLNNVEQVTINSPAAGVYTIVVKGHSIPYGPQHYVLAYDIIPKTMELTFPLGGEQLSNTDSLRVFWNDIPDGNPFSVLFSPDNGGSWLTVANSIPANVHYCSFVPAGYNNGQCLVRVHRNGTAETSTSQPFAITAQTVVQLAASQCPGYMNVHWSPVPDATAYQVMKKIGAYMQVVDTATDTTYSFGGLPLTDMTYVAVRPIVNGTPGYRSKALYTVPNSGNCTNPVSSGDMMVQQILLPSSGRMFTSNALTTSTSIVVNVRNLYALPCVNYTLSYQVNSGPWQTVVNPGTIPANSVFPVTLPAFDLSLPGNYNIVVAVHNLDLPDPQPGNDTIAVTIKNLPNDPVDLSTAFFDGFEDLAVFSVTHDSIGVTPNAHWDYFNINDTGRMRSFVYDSIAITGNRAVSLDEYQAASNGSKNTFVGTFNLSGYDTAATEVRVDFDYILHGTPKSSDGNIVTARGVDTDPWSPLYTYDLSVYPGFVTPVRSLSLTDAMRFSGRNFTASTQLSFGQNDTSLIAGINYGNGITLDNFKLYTVANDAMLTQVISPLPGNCGLPSTVPLTVQVHNGVNYTLHNVQMFYSMDSGTVYTGVIDSIRAKDTINFTFAQQLAIGIGTTHSLNVWLMEGGDTYIHNDSILNYHFRNSQIVTGYPYLENFEGGDGGYYTDGFKSSWQYGTPASPNINKAASGTKAWKTNLTGRYNSLEKSYLYSPCFDISQLTNPTFSFSAAMDLENCGSTLCDGAWVEYSFDGVLWTKLGAAGQGTNWYDSTFNLWNTNGFTRWHVATISLPQPPAGGTLHLRFVLSSDPAVDFEGLAVDDVHIYDLANPIFPASGVTTLSQNVSGNQWNDYLVSNQLLASLQPNNQSILNAVATLYAHDTLSNPSATQYTFPRSYTIKPGQLPADSVAIRLYLLDSDVVRVLKDTTCASCPRIRDAYSLGVTQYTNSNTVAENGTLADDTGGVFAYYPYQGVQWVPYDRGYYAQLNVKPLSEFWFNDGGPTHNFPAGVDYLNFVAFKSASGVTTYWYSLIDTTVASYTLQRSGDGSNFDSVTTKAATHTSPASYTYNDPIVFTGDTALYYRLTWQMVGKSTTYYSPIRKVDNSDSTAGLIVFNAAMAGSRDALVNWISYIDGIVDHYTLERAIDNGAYTTIDIAPALRHYGQQYYYNDMPEDRIISGEPVHYRLTAVLADGTEVVLIRTVIWIDGSAVLSIYPNPTSDGSFTIRWFAEPGTEMQLEMTDALGRRMDKGSFIATQWSNTTVLQTANRPKGIYFVKMDIGGTKYTARIVYE